MDSNLKNQHIVDDVAAAIVQFVKPGESPAVVAKAAAILARADIVNESDIRHALLLCRDFKTSLPAITKWVLEGLSLREVERLLVVREMLGEEYNAITIPSIREFVEYLNPQALVEPLAAYKVTQDGIKFVAYSGISDELTSMFDDLLAEMPSTQTPLHRLLHVLDDKFGGDIGAAHRLACDSPDEFRDVVNGRKTLVDVKLTDAFELVKPWGARTGLHEEAPEETEE